MADQVFVALLLVTLVTAGAAAAAVEGSRWIRGRIRRYRVQKEIRRADLRAVARDMAAVGLPTVPLRVAIPGHRRSVMAGPEVQPLRNGEPRDPGAARVLAFRIALADRGYEVDELQIHKRIN